MGSYWSSFSDTISHLRTVQGRGDNGTPKASARGPEAATTSMPSSARCDGAAVFPSMAVPTMGSGVATRVSAASAVAATGQEQGTVPRAPAMPTCSAYSVDGESIVQERTGRVDVLELD
jgi:hypothetical protein